MGVEEGVRHQARLALLSEKAGASRFLGQHRQHHVTFAPLKDFDCLVVVCDGRAVDRHEDIPLEQEAIGNGARLDITNPWMAIVPLVIAVQHEALRMENQTAKGHTEARGRRLGKTSARISCPRSAC